MALVVPNQAESILLQLLVNKITAPSNLVLRLYRTNIVPGETDTETAYNTNEATFTGYSAITLTGASWTVTEDAPSHIDYAQQTFTMGTPGTTNTDIYGYYVTQSTGGKLMWAEKFTDAPYSMVNAGDTIKITPVITLE